MPTNPLVPFALTLAIAWGSVVATGVRYVLVMPAPAAQPEPPPPPPPTPPPPTPPVTPPPNPRPTPVPPVTPVALNPNSAGIPKQPDHPPPPTERLPTGVNWSTGGLLVLVVPTVELKNVRSEFADEVRKLDGEKERLVGGGVFVVGRTRLWPWERWAAQAWDVVTEVRGEGESAADEFARSFGLAAADRATVAGRRGRDPRTAVVWHSVTAPTQAPAPFPPMPDAFVVWSGVARQDQLANRVLPQLFAPRDPIYPLGLDGVHGIAANVRDLFPRPLPGAP